MNIDGGQQALSKSISGYRDLDDVCFVPRGRVQRRRHNPRLVHRPHRENEGTRSKLRSGDRGRTIRFFVTRRWPDLVSRASCIDKTRRHGRRLETPGVYSIIRLIQETNPGYLLGNTARRTTENYFKWLLEKSSNNFLDSLDCDS